MIMTIDGCWWVDVDSDDYKDFKDDNVTYKKKVDDVIQRLLGGNRNEQNYYYSCY